MDLKELIIEDAEGRPRITLAMNDDGDPQFTMLGPDGIPRLRIMASTMIGPSVTLATGSNTGSIILQLFENGNPIIIIQDAHGEGQTITKDLVTLNHAVPL